MVKNVVLLRIPGLSLRLHGGWNSWRSPPKTYFRCLLAHQFIVFTSLLCLQYSGSERHAHRLDCGDDANLTFDDCSLECINGGPQPTFQKACNQTKQMGVEDKAVLGWFQVQVLLQLYLLLLK